MRIGPWARSSAYLSLADGHLLTPYAANSYLLRLQSQARAAGTRVDNGMPSPADTTATEVDWAFPGTDNWVLCRPGQYRECRAPLQATCLCVSVSRHSPPV